MSLKVSVLGSGMEVGRSCLSVNDNTLLDCGIMMSEELDPAPGDYFPKVKNPRKIRNVFISHAHLDHSGYFPFMVDSGFTGKAYCTKPTRDLLRVLYADSLRLAKGPWGALDEGILDEVLNALIPIEYGEEIRVQDGSVTFLRSHHILGSALTHVQVGGRSMLYTSDFSAGRTRCFKGAMSEIKRHEELHGLDALFLESTYGDTTRPPRGEREDYLLHAITESFDRGKRVMLPSFALGRAQELERIFVENRSKIPYANLHADGMIREMNRIHNRFQKYMDTEFPLVFREVTRSVRDQVLGDPQGIIVTTSGFCEGGPIRFYLDNASPEDTVIFSTTYAPRGSMADKIKFSKAYEDMPLNVEEVDLSAHSSYKESRELVEAIEPRASYVLHGDPVPEKFLAYQVGGYPVVNGQRVSV